MNTDKSGCENINIYLFHQICYWISVFIVSIHHLSRGCTRKTIITAETNRMQFKMLFLRVSNKIESASLWNFPIFIKVAISRGISGKLNVYSCNFWRCFKSFKHVNCTMMKTNINVELMKAVKERLWGLWEWDWCSKNWNDVWSFFMTVESWFGTSLVLIKYQTLMMIVFMIFI